MGGIECAQHIREHEKNGLLTKHLTIIATTANAREEQVQMAYDAGMVSHRERLTLTTIICGHYNFMTMLTTV